MSLRQMATLPSRKRLHGRSRKHCSVPSNTLKAMGSSWKQPQAHVYIMLLWLLHNGGSGVCSSWHLCLYLKKNKKIKKKLQSTAQHQWKGTKQWFQILHQHLKQSHKTATRSTKYKVPNQFGQVYTTFLWSWLFHPTYFYVWVCYKYN